MDEVRTVLSGVSATSNSASWTWGSSGASSSSALKSSGECQTCQRRRYQDGSNDPGVSFKTPTNIAPASSEAMVRAHEGEHVRREQDKASLQGREVVSQSVQVYTRVCPECGQTYVAGGRTTTVTKAESGGSIPTPQASNAQTGAINSQRLDVRI